MGEGAKNRSEGESCHSEILGGLGGSGGFGGLFGDGAVEVGARGLDVRGDIDGSQTEGDKAQDVPRNEGKIEDEKFKFVTLHESDGAALGFGGAETGVIGHEIEHLRIGEGFDNARNDEE